MKTNIVLDKEPDMIWVMVEQDNRISLRFDCGDAGVVMLTPELARELVEDVSALLKSVETPEVSK